MREFLPNTYKLNNNLNSYAITGVIGEGASCIAYKAKVVQTGENCIVKEYYPMSYSLYRNPDQSISCSSEDLDKYTKGIKRFSKSIDRQIELRNIGNTSNQTFFVLDRFEMNNTYYVVVPQMRGDTLKKAGYISLYDRIRICKSVIDYVGKCHKAGYLCLDIKPDNIFILPETNELALFFDFDSVLKKEEIVMGSTTSYTESWAAPEQIIPGAYNKISESTDIYILGELLYWLIFDKHSDSSDRRRDAVFDFSISKFSDELSIEAENIISEIFHNTIRSSYKNRYSSVEKLVEIINRLIYETYPGKECLINVMPYNAPVFVGRDKELKAIKRVISEKKIVFLNGVGGIGKSEIAKQYAISNRDVYKNIIYMTFSIDFVNTINQVECITEFEQKENESDIHFCKRKIRKLSELNSGNMLIVIDNMNITLEECKQIDIWKQLCSIECDMLITTRNQQDSYKDNQITVDEIDNDNLCNLFRYYCPFESVQQEYVYEIINGIAGHTLALELIAKQAKVDCKLPCEILGEFKERGLLGFDDIDIKHEFHKASVSAHIKELYSIAQISGEKEFILNRMLFMPVDGINKNVFINFFQIEDKNKINDLIDAGWINEVGEKDEYISVHPIVASIISESLFANEKEVLVIFQTATKSLLSLNASGKVVQQDLIRITRSLVLQSETYGFKNEGVADFINHFVQWYTRYGNRDFRRRMILHAIDIYNSIFPMEEYVARREMAYTIYSEIINDGCHTNELSSMFKEHIALAERKRDLYLMGNWYLARASSARNPFERTYFYSKTVIVAKRISKELHKKNSILLSSNYLIPLHYGYLLDERAHADKILQVNSMGILGNIIKEDIFLMKDSTGIIANINKEISLRKQYTKDISELNANSMAIIVDYAKIDILKRDYEAAVEKMIDLINRLTASDIPANKYLYKLCLMVASVKMIQKDYNIASVYLNKCLEMSESLGYISNYGARIRLVKCYLHRGEKELAKQINFELFSELKDDDSDAREYYLGKMYYNEGCIQLAYNNEVRAEEFWLHAISHFEKYETWSNSRNIGIARCNRCIAELYYETDIKRARELLKKVYAEYKYCWGDKHPETIEVKKLLSDIR